MSSRQKQPGTMNPEKRISKAIDKRLENPQNKDKKPNTKPKSGSKADRRRTKDPTKVGQLHRRPGNKKKIKTKGELMDDIIRVVQYIIENHGKNINTVMEHYKDKKMLSQVAQKCMSTCLSGWTETENGLVSENTNLVLSKKSWEIDEDGSAKVRNGFKFNYDWLYDLSNNPINEDIDAMGVVGIDKDSFSDTLSNASNLLRKLSDKEVKKYILNAAKGDEDVDLMNLKEILEDTGVNWDFAGSEINDDRINLFIKVRYTKDGTQEGVVEKKLSIEVKPTADVTDATDTGIERNKDIDLTFAPEIPETESSPEADLEAGLDDPDIDVEL